MNLHDYPDECPAVDFADFRAGVEKAALNGAKLQFRPAFSQHLPWADTSVTVGPRGLDWRTFEFRVAKPKVAEGYNPLGLTEEQVGVADGWRLLTEAELWSRDNDSCGAVEHWRDHVKAFCYTFCEFEAKNASGYHAFRTKHPAGFYLPKKKVLKPWTHSSVPKGDCWIRFGGASSTCWRRIVSLTETSVMLMETPRSDGLYRYEELANQCEHSLDGGKTWAKCGTEEDSK